MKYEYEEFKKALKALLQERLGEKVKVEFINNLKNNQTVKEGIQITKNGSDESVVFYPNELYGLFQGENGTEECVEELLKIFQNMKRTMPEKNLKCWEEVKLRVRAYLIQKSWNEEYLKKLCHAEYLDLAVVFEVVLEENWEGIKSFVITLEMLEQWGVRMEEVYYAAMQNLKKEKVTIWEQDNLSFFKGNRYKNGAGVMLRKDILKEFAEKRGTDIYILPSSVHELVLMEKNEKWSIECLKAMVCEINRDSRTMIPEDRLSDSVYLYQRELDEIIIVA